MHKILKLIAIFGLTLLLAGGVWFIYSGSCLKWAIDNNNSKLLNVFLWMGAPIDADFGAYGDPLTHAVSCRDIGAICVLVKHGASVDTYPFRDLSLLAWAYTVAKGPEVGQTLLSVGADVNFLAMPSSGRTVLMYLLSYKTLDINKIRSVLKCSPDLQIQDAEGRSSVDYIVAREVELRALGLRAEDWLK